MMMNKKAFGYSEFFVLITLIALPFAILGANNHLSSSDHVIGSKQAPLFSACFERSSILNIIDDNAVLALNVSLDEFDNQAGFLDNPCGGRYEECAIVNTRSLPRNLCLPDLSNSINKIFSKKLDYLNKRSKDPVLINNEFDYELYFNDRHVKGISLNELVYSLDAVSDVKGYVDGEFSFKPSFTIIQNNELNLFKRSIFPVLKNLVNNCVYVSDTLTCFSDFIPEDDDNISWSLNFVDDQNLYLINVYFNRFDRSVCYGVFLPKNPEN